MRRFSHQRLQTLTILIVIDRRPPRSGLVGEAIQAIPLPAVQPSRDSVPLDLQDLADLVDGVTLVAEQDSMSTPALGRFARILARVTEGLDFGIGKGLYEAHGGGV